MDNSNKIITFKLSIGEYEEFSKVCRENFGEKSKGFVMRLLVNYFTNGLLKIKVVPTNRNIPENAQIP